MYGRLAAVRFANTTLEDCQLRSADLRDAIFEDCRIIRCNIEKAELHGSQFVNTNLEHMDFWGWHGYAGAEIPDEQKFKYFIAKDAASRLRRSVVDDKSERFEPFVRELDSSGFGTGEVMLKYDEWKGVISFEDFIRAGKILTE